jgi:RimJ/RimL family protein N-acetyltransferase
MIVVVKHETAFERELWGEAIRNSPSSLVPARKIMTGDLVQLEPLDPGIHGAALYQASHGSEQALEIWTYLPWGPWPSESEFLKHLAGNAARFDYIWYVFRLKGGGGIKGMACYLDIQPTQGVIEIGGIWFAPDMQRTRAATEALFLMLDYAMSDLRYRRMQWRCNALNRKSREAALRLGFKYEGIFYNHMIYKGLNRDTAWYSILDSDWPDVRKAIAAWLDDGNFDGGGMARSSLRERMGKRAAAPCG